MATKVLVVDDEERLRQLEVRMLQGERYSCTTAASSAEARQCLLRQRFDLALVDVNMPGESGLSLAKFIRDEFPATATLIVTGLDDLKVAKQALEAGTYGYLVKPFEKNDLLIQVRAALIRRMREKADRDHRTQVEQTLEERTVSMLELSSFLGDAYTDVEEMILRLAIAGECRDDETGRHVERMSRYCGLLAQRAGEDAEHAKLIRLASTTHDLGKVGIPDHVLHKAGPLTQDERKIMQRHVEIGYRILQGSRAVLLQTAATIALTHHEKYDGSGYPRGLAGEAIPLAGRIAAIADVFDALTSDRVYRPAFSLDQALDIMRAGSATHFDPKLLELFLASLDDVRSIQSQFPSEQRSQRTAPLTGESLAAP
ncbi:MAG: HD domain-containing phosphohydrolase [Pirellulales bacterium]